MNDSQTSMCRSGGFSARLRAFLLSCCALLGAPGPAAWAGSDAPAFQFAVIGDMPYTAGQRAEFLNLMKEVDAEDVAFVVHVGDLWFDGKVWKESSKGLPPCADPTFADRLALVQASLHPFILTPGDNDWADCYRAKPQAFDPLERLGKLRQMFFSGDVSLGQHSLKLRRQSDDPRYAEYRENVIWTRGDVLFITLHMVGGNNNRGRTEAMDAEYEERNTANLAWMKQAFALARKNGNRALVIFSQADPQFETTWPAIAQKRYLLGGLGIKAPGPKPNTGFEEFLEELEHETLSFGRPVLYVHGDTHTFRVDSPLFGATSRRRIENFTRVETTGYKDTHWTRVTVDPADPGVFQVSQEIVAANRVRH